MQAEFTIYSKVNGGETFITVSTGTEDEFVYYTIELDVPEQSEEEIEELLRMIEEAKKKITALRALVKANV